jgi:hypothetical protein
VVPTIKLSESANGGEFRPKNLVGAVVRKNKRQNENGNSFELAKVVLDSTYRGKSVNYSSTHSL